MDSKTGFSHMDAEHNEKGNDFLNAGDLKDAREANIREHSTTLREALRDYKWAIIWSLIISMSVIMEGYDTILVGSFYGYPAFQKQFGKYSASAKSYQVAGRWQAAIGAGTQAGAIVGAFLNGWLTPKFGYKPVFIGANVLMISFIFVSFFGKTVQEQTAGQVLCGRVYRSVIATNLADEQTSQRPMGYFRNHRPSLCIRAPPSCSSAVSYIVHQYVLLHRPIHRRGCAARPCQSSRSVVLPHPFRHPVDMAAVPPGCRLLHARVALLAHSQRST
jgi:hypothetical protein